MERVYPRFNKKSHNYRVQSVVSAMDVGHRFPTSKVILDPSVKDLHEASVHGVLNKMQCVAIVVTHGGYQGGHIRQKVHDPRIRGQETLCQGCHYAKPGTVQCIILFEDLRE